VGSKWGPIDLKTEKGGVVKEHNNKRIKNGKPRRKKQMKCLNQIKGEKEEKGGPEYPGEGADIY
jgi:hypothetical protein